MLPQVPHLPIYSLPGAFCFLDTGHLCDHHLSFSGASARLNSSQLNKLFFLVFVFSWTSVLLPVQQVPLLEVQCQKHVTKAEGLLILPGSLCSYFCVPFYCLPFSQQHNIFDWCSACDLCSPLILYCSTAAKTDSPDLWSFDYFPTYINFAFVLIVLHPGFFSDHFSNSSKLLWI